MKGRVIRRHIPGSPRAFTFHCEFKLGKDICDYTLHNFITCLWTLLFFLHIFHTHVFARVTCSIDLFSVQGAILSQKKTFFEHFFIKLVILKFFAVSF